MASRAGEAAAGGSWRTSIRDEGWRRMHVDDLRLRVLLADAVSDGGKDQDGGHRDEDEERREDDRPAGARYALADRAAARRAFPLATKGRSGEVVYERDELGELGVLRVQQR